MEQRAGRGRRGGAARALPREGAARRTQLISTYGVGSMIALGERSFIVSGLDSWKVGTTPDLHEFRLESRLGVRGFFRPPAADQAIGDGVRVRLFPELYSCPGVDDGCTHNLRRYREFNSPANRNECSSCGGGLTPSRFVVACRNGHIDEFPYWRWVHAGKPGGDTASSGHKLSYRATGRTASLRSIIIGCSCGKEASMEGAFSTGAIKSIGYTCAGGRPWLGSGAFEHGCDAECRTLQRGSSAAWFPVVRSALSIPPYSRPLFDAVMKHFAIWAGEDDDLIIKQARKLGISGKEFTDADVVGAVRDLEGYEAGERPDPTQLTGFEASDVLRQEEYKQLGSTADDGDFQCVPPRSDPTASLPEGIGATMLVKRLREVRVLQTFSRVAAPTEGDGKERLAALSTGSIDWLPGVEVSGEGVFLRLDPDVLHKWETESAGPERRARRIREQHEANLAARAGRSGRPIPASPVRARLLLVHTLAHVLINEWSLDAGYPASALRERLYISDDMAGLLIYTASGDSAGSLGGLVGQGETRRLRASLRAALDRASWCSADPLCMESEAAGTDSLNLAACHSCVLLPETSCELNNTFLDRAVLIGSDDEDEKVEGFFRSTGRQ